ncbi:MAG: hypothetical protein WCK73_07330 [Deltaproteobacteria bacterium]
MRRAAMVGVVLATLAGSATGADAPPPEEPSTQQPDPLPLPPGTPADQALWKATRDATHEVVAVRWKANALHLQVRNTTVVARLNAAAKADPAAEARLVDIRTRLGAAQAENYAIYTERWPVDTTRVCQYPLLYLTSAMNSGESPETRMALAEARDGAKKCVDQARSAVARMGRSNAALSAVLAEAEAALQKS